MKLKMHNDTVTKVEGLPGIGKNLVQTEHQMEVVTGLVYLRTKFRLVDRVQ